MNEGDFVRLYQRGTANRRDAARVGCVPPEALLAVVEQQGSEEERLASINHAMTCADCGEELELLRATRVVRDRAASRSPLRSSSWLDWGTTRSLDAVRRNPRWTAQ